MQDPMSRPTQKKCWYSRHQHTSMVSCKGQLHPIQQFVHHQARTSPMLGRALRTFLLVIRHA